jgi:NAD+ diphosphatase
MTKQPLVFSQMPLDRGSSKRKKPAWLAQQLDASNTLLIPIWRGKYLTCQQSLLERQRNHHSADKLIAFANETLFLGHEQDRAIFVLDFSSLTEQAVTELFESSYNLSDLRHCMALLSAMRVPVFGYAKALAYWHSQNQYCGSCGHKSAAFDGGHMRRCLDKHCAKQQFPRTDPVVIMLVEHLDEHGQARCLLAQHHHMPKQRVSTLAGFVDPGESLEEAVTREVFEEAGVKVAKVSYIASQPWPFPSSLMIGFIASATDPRITIDDEEIADAHWFTPKQIRAFGNWGDTGDNYQMPRKESIARHLIELWLEKHPD